MHTAMLMALVLGAPWMDGEGRYQLELPKGWRLHRAESTPERPVFWASKRRKGTATASVEVLSVPDAIGLGGVHRERLVVVKATPGASLLEDGAAVIDGYRGRALHYTMTAPGEKKSKTVREFMTQVFNRGYVVTFSADSRHFDAYADDFVELIGTFTPLKTGSEPQRSRGGESPLIGRWVKVKNPQSVLVLSADGSVEMGRERGSYAVSRDTIVTLLEDGGQKVFQWNVRGRTLVLKSPRGPVKYRRAP